MRGLLSNEAGCGTAPFAHATSSAKEPAEQGAWGIFEVFADTILLCTVTAVVIILNYEACAAYSSNGVMMTVRAFSAVLGDGASYYLCLAVFLFAYATVVCWAQYGVECVRYLTEKMSPSIQKWGRRGYIALFCGCILIGALCSPSSVWALSDFSIGSMTLINLFVLCLGAGEVKRYTDRVYGKSLTVR
jgi:AGCS family alanine or glycine:cation symporter